jgi:membrane protease YdiL (CAAX protease family)
MDSNLAATDVGTPLKPSFPYSNWGPLAAILGVFLALGTGVVLGIPAVIADHPKSGEDLSTWADAFIQLATAVGFLMVPMLIAARRGATSFREVLARLGVRRFKPSALKWMAAAIGAYLFFAIAYAIAIGEPHQEDIADKLGAIPVQIFLIVVAAPVSEEVCFRGMLFGGLRERWPRIAAALVSATVFGGLHATTGISAVPPLIFFGFALALLYEKTGSIVPGIMLHMLNISVALLGQ